MGKLKLNRSKKAQSEFIFIVILSGISIILIASLFFIFSEIRNENLEFLNEKKLEILGEKIASSIVNVYTFGENMHYNNTETKLLYSTNIIIPKEYVQYVINASSDKVVITHRSKKKEIKIHNLNNVQVNGIVTGKNKITINYYKNQTSRKIYLE